MAFGISQETFEPWTAADSILCFKIISFSVTYDWGPTLHREALRQTHPDLEVFSEDIYSFTADMMDEIVPILDDDDLKRMGHYSEKTLSQRYRESAARVKASQAPLPEERASTPYSKPVQQYKMKLSEYLGGDSSLLNDHGMASNNFVVHGDHTETGLPLYESDPHLKNSLPGFWMLANLHDTKSGRNLSGILLPGTTSLVMGRSDDISFSGTVSRAD